MLILASVMLLCTASALAGDGCVSVFGLEHCPLGQAVLEVDTAGNLIISNIGSSGEDGVSIHVPPFQLLDIAILPLGNPSDPGNPIPDGAFIEMTARGTIGGIANQLVAVGHYEDTGPQVTATFDLSPVEPISLLGKHFCDDCLVHQETVDPEEATYLCSIWPDTWDISFIDLSIDWTFSCHPVTTPSGIDILTEYLEVKAVEPANPPVAYSLVTLTAKDIPTITITGEELVGRDIPTLTEWGMIIFGVVLLGFITWVFLRRRKVAGVRV